MIKAIETQYKGYRFRSRLEARWAVFFDALGVQWEYEKEGYDLKDNGYYLPDFWLPDQKAFIEIKPGTSEGTKRMYLAGKFTGGSGKNSGVDWRASFGVDFDYCGSARSLPDYHYEYTIRGYLYCGPYPIDLSSGHGDPGHFETITPESDPDDEDGRIVSQKCLGYIKNSDFLFAWIFSDDCYGTIAEIGYAKGIGKPVYIGVRNESNIGDMWFVLTMADKVVFADTSIDAFDKVIPQPREDALMSALIKGLGDCRGVIFHGDPLESIASIWQNGIYVKGRTGLDTLHRMFGKIPVERISESGIAARSARFEHGEKPNFS